MALSKDDVRAALAKVSGPDGKPLPETGTLSDIVVTDGKVFFSITVDAAAVPQWEPVRARAEQAVRAVAGVTSALVALTGERAGGRGRHAAAPPASPNPSPDPRATCAGPPAGSPVAARRRLPPAFPASAPLSRSLPARAASANRPRPSILRLGLRDLGLKVGILDADIYGPSLPKLLGIRERPETIGGTRLKPIVRHGMPVMSIGFLIEEETPMIWRGPMVMSALTQMLREVEWGALDVMVVDMPPGTGDAQLTMAQQVPLKGAVIVSTPQDLALIDARRGIAMFRRVNVPVLGIVENMSYFPLPALRWALRYFRSWRRAGRRPSGSACRFSAKCRSISRFAKSRTKACQLSPQVRTAHTRKSIATLRRACAMASPAQVAWRRKS